jgi:hypothetical protein
MQTVGLLLLAGFSAVLAHDQIWMELMSSQIVSAAGKDVAADKNIPQLANDLGLKTLVDLVTRAKLADALSGAGKISDFI